MARLKAREEFYEKVFARMESHVSRVIESLGPDPKGKRKKLEGTTVTFSLRGCHKRAEVTDEAAVPAKYKRVTVTLPAETGSWCAIRSTWISANRCGRRSHLRSRCLPAWSRPT